MNVKILTLVIVLVVSLLCSASAGPMASTEHSKELEEVGSMRTPLRQNSARAGRSQRPSGWRRRRLDPASPIRGPCHFRARHSLECPPLGSDFYALPLPWGALQQGAFASPA